MVSFATSRRSSGSWAFAVVASMLFMMPQSISGQEVGVDICACQPSVYEITLNFGLMCNDTDVMGPGINETACLIASRLPDTENVTDLVPAQVSEIQILELDQQQDVVGQSVFTDGPYFDGDKIYYTSIVRTNPELINPVSLPRGLQVSINGNNVFNQPLLNSWGILYSNDCGIFPLLDVGERIGWSVFTDLGDPPLKFCPIGPPTMFPTSVRVPTVSPTIAPTSKKTDAPTLSPTKEKTDSPTVAPVAGTAAPAPTDEPSAPSCPPPDGPKTGGNLRGDDKKMMGKMGKKGEKKIKKKKKDYYYGGKKQMQKMPKKTKKNKMPSAKMQKVAQKEGLKMKHGKMQKIPSEKKLKKMDKKKSGKGGSSSKGYKYDYEGTGETGKSGKDEYDSYDYDGGESGKSESGDSYEGGEGYSYEGPKTGGGVRRLATGKDPVPTYAPTAECPEP